MSAGERLPGTPAPAHVWTGHAGVRIAGDTWGDPAGTAVILLHGSGQTRHAWKATGEVLGEAGFRAVAFDARGHGDSDWSPDADYSQDAMVRDLVAVIQSLGLQKVVLVGASMGGGTCLVAAGEGAVDALALILVDVAPRIEPEGVQRIRDFMTRNPDGFASLEQVADAIAGYQPHRTRPTSLGGLAKNVRLGKNGRYFWHWDPRMMTRRQDLDSRERRLTACARNLQVPSLLVKGGISDVVTEAGVQAFLQAAPRTAYLNISGAGHMVAGDRNDLFGKATVEYLTRPGLLQNEISSTRRSSLMSRLDAGDLNEIP